MRVAFSGTIAICILLYAIGPSSAAAGSVTAFQPGERLEYVLKWAGIPAGDSIMEIVEGDEVEGATLYRVISTAKSRSFVDLVYKVRNRYETHIHPSDGLTRMYVFDMKEGGKRENRTYLFDQNSHSVRRISEKKKRIQADDYEILPQTQDTLSALYALRNESLEKGDSISYNVFEGTKNWELVIDVIAEEEIEVRAGKFETLVVYPKLKFEGIFRRKGELHVWLTKDQWHIPVLMRSKVRIGSIDAELVRFDLGSEGKEIPSMLPLEEDY